MTRLYQACLQPANDDSSHVRITIYVGTCASWFLKPSGAKDNGREERSAGSVRRIAKEMRGEDHEERRMDRWTCSIRRSRGSPQSPPAYRFWKPTRGWSLSVFPISPSLSLSLPLSSWSSFLCTKDGTKIHKHWPANCPQGGGSFYVGGSRVPGPNTVLIEMFIERLRRIIGEQFR